jgi:hypothetical protein
MVPVRRHQGQNGQLQAQINVRKRLVRQMLLDIARTPAQNPRHRMSHQSMLTRTSVPHPGQAAPLMGAAERNGFWSAPGKYPNTAYAPMR